MSAYKDQPRTYNADLSALVPRAKVYFYEVGTTNKKSAYAEASIHAPLVQGDPSTISYAVPLPNPLTSNEAARLPDIFLDGSYRIYITDEDGAEIYDLDPFVDWPAPAIVTPLSNSGEILPFSTLTFYRSKTTILASITGDNPITADENGEFAAVELTDGIAYRAILRDRYGQLIYDVDPVAVIAQGPVTVTIIAGTGVAEDVGPAIGYVQLGFMSPGFGELVADGVALPTYTFGILESAFDDPPQFIRIDWRVVDPLNDPIPGNFAFVSVTFTGEAGEVTLYTVSADTNLQIVIDGIPVGRYWAWYRDPGIDLIDGEEYTFTFEF